MADLVERLLAFGRKRQTSADDPAQWPQLRDHHGKAAGLAVEAAEEITRLRAELTEVDVLQREVSGLSDENERLRAEQQLVARIKRSSKYFGQTPAGKWFDVRVVDDRAYRVRGNDNNYRTSDLAFGVRLADGSIVELT